ncbi:MAG: carboxypeptidase-like regulatory domain-containing protein, partial [Bacteroidota bacterium]
MRKNYELIFAFLMFFCASFVFAQSVTITGKVSEEGSNEPLFGVTVLIEGSEVGSTTDFDGNYSIEAKDTKGKNLMFSYIGYETTTIVLSGESQVINVSLKQSATQLDEVVVTALGIKREQKALGYSLTKVGGEDLTQVKTTSAVNALQGRVAGVNISTNSSGASGSSRVIIRGASSMTGNNQPLYVIDGIPTINTTKASVGAEDGHFGDGGDDISDINSNDIESISVLKGAAAAALYGALASNGVVMITTKSGKKGTDLGVEYSGSLTFQKIDMSLIDAIQTSYGQGRSGLKPGYAWETDEDGNLL